MLGVSPKGSYLGKFEQSSLHCCLGWVRERERDWMEGGKRERGMKAKIFTVLRKTVTKMLTSAFSNQ